jgi:hypothetical protein
MSLPPYGSTVEGQAIRPRGRNDVAIWRREQLVRSGVPFRLATRAANDDGYDLHALIELLRHGCPPELAIRILAPDENKTAHDRPRRRWVEDRGELSPRTHKTRPIDRN